MNTITRQINSDDMALEIERKYLVKDDSFKGMAERVTRIRQGYLNRDPERTVRVRVRDDKGYVTIKGRNQGAVRKEFEYEIPVDDAEELLGLCDGVILEKYRYEVEYYGFVWEIDEYKGKQEPLVVAEIELPSADTKFSIPTFIDREVTGDIRYYNSQLS